MVPCLRGSVQRARARLLCCVGVRTGFEQLLHNALVPCCAAMYSAVAPLSIGRSTMAPARSSIATHSLLPFWDATYKAHAPCAIRAFASAPRASSSCMHRAASHLAQHTTAVCPFVGSRASSAAIFGAVRSAAVVSSHARTCASLSEAIACCTATGTLVLARARARARAGAGAGAVPAPVRVPRVRVLARVQVGAAGAGWVPGGRWRWRWRWRGCGCGCGHRRRH